MCIHGFPTGSCLGGSLIFICLLRGLITRMIRIKLNIMNLHWINKGSSSNHFYLPADFDQVLHTANKQN